MSINRDIKQKIEQRLFKGKVVVLQGPRQVGKTTLVKELVEKYGQGRLNCYINCDSAQNAKSLEVASAEKLKNFLGEGNFFVFDEAQKVKNIGLILKILVDTYPEIQIVATGSSSFYLSKQLGEPLVGRMYKFIMYPISLKEINIFKNYENKRDVINNDLNNLLLYGNYPEIISNKAENKIEYLTNLSSNFIYKDIAGYEEIRQPEILRNLLVLLAYQIGGEVSYTELGNKLGVRRETVMRYIYILEEAFVIYRLTAFARNLRTEINKKIKIYFYDLGVRNAIIENFKNIEDRDDVGKLWENFCFIERMKKIEIDSLHRNIYFWRTTDKKEIDYIEEYDGSLYGYEFKWGKDDFRIPKKFIETYKGSSAMAINKSNFLEWLV